jgi:hypothetical protein
MIGKDNGYNKPTMMEMVLVLSQFMDLSPVNESEHEA